MRERYPGITIRLLTTDEIISPAIGITHVSLRAGNEPSGSDIIARQLLDPKMGLYCHEDYIAELGLPQLVDEFAEDDWLLPSSEIRAGIGIGLMSAFKHKSRDGLVKLPYSLPAAIGTDGLWFVYHRNYIGNIKIKAFQKCLEECLRPLAE